MTESGQAATAPAGKRERLVEAAREILHVQGVERTTIAEIARAADVPTGNVYYYYKAKDDLVAAAVDGHTDAIRQVLTGLERRHRSPRARLKAFVKALSGQADLVAQHGRPHGGLCSELDKRADGCGSTGAPLVEIPLAWARK